jgi:hypothetical protein
VADREAILAELGVSPQDLQILQAYREQGATIADANNQLLLHKTLPADLQTPEVFEALMGDPAALQAVISDPQAMQAFEKEYRVAIAGSKYDSSLPQPMQSTGLPPGADVMSILTLPVDSVNSAQALRMDASFFRNLALAGGDWDPNKSR